MAKADWGTKRICNSCGAKFYDFARTPIVCPKCATPYEEETPQRGRRAKPVREKPAAKPAPAPAPAAKVEADEAEDVELGESDDLVEMDDDDDSDLIEATEDLDGDEEEKEG